MVDETISALQGLCFERTRMAGTKYSGEVYLKKAIEEVKGFKQHEVRRQ